MIKTPFHLQAANVISITTPDLDVVKIEVTDPDLWRKHLDQLMPLFAKVIFEEYEKEHFDNSDPNVIERALHQLQVSFNDISFMYVLMDKEKFVGLIAIKTYKEQPKVGIIIEIIVDPEYRGKKVALKLYDLVFKTKEYYAIFGYSRYPAAVNARYKVGQQYGYTTYFGGVSKGNPILEDLQQDAVTYFVNEGIVSNLKAPLGFMFLKGEENINSPLLEGEAKFNKSDALYQPFQQILKIQKKTSKDTAVGILISILEESD